MSKITSAGIATSQINENKTMTKKVRFNQSAVIFSEDETSATMVMSDESKRSDAVVEAVLDGAKSEKHDTVVEAALDGAIKNLQTKVHIFRQQIREDKQQDDISKDTHRGSIFRDVEKNDKQVKQVDAVEKDQIQCSVFFTVVFVIIPFIMFLFFFIVFIMHVDF